MRLPPHSSPRIRDATTRFVSRSRRLPVPRSVYYVGATARCDRWTRARDLTSRRDSGRLGGGGFGARPPNSFAPPGRRPAAAGAGPPTRRPAAPPTPAVVTP